MKSLTAILVCLLSGPVLLAGGPTHDHSGAVRAPARPAAPPPQAPPAPARIPLFFEPVGAEDGRPAHAPAFLARTSQYSLTLRPTSAEIRPVAASPAVEDPQQPLVMRFEGTAAGPREVTPERAPGTVSYLVGSDAGAWRTGVPTYSRVRYLDVYPGVDVAYYGTDREIEYDLIVAPGADPAAVRLRFDGATLGLDAAGGLTVDRGRMSLVLRAPVSYQRVHGRRTPVPSRYVVHADGAVGIEVGAYDRSRPLVIDPILSYSALLGGQGLDEAAAVAVDAAGNIYLAGTTASSNFPGTTGAAAALDVFVAKLDPRGTGLLFAAYIGGSGLDEARGLAIDAEGHAYVVGTTRSSNFPTRAAQQAALAGDADGFLFKLSTTGAGLVFSTYQGGTQFDEVNGVAVDPARNVYVAGSTRSTDLPLVAARQAASGGHMDGFVARYGAGGALQFATYHGGSGLDTTTAIGVDPAGNATVTGATSSSDFPLLNQARGANAGRVDAFVSRFTPSGALIFSTYVGGTGFDAGQAVAVASTGASFVAGSTTSPDFPVVAPIQGAPGGAMDAFLMALSPSGGLAWATYYGGARGERGRALALNPSGRLVLAGQTMSPNLPVLRAAQSVSGGNRDTFVVQIDPPHTAFSYATYLGGSNSDEGLGAAIDAVGRVFVAGGSSYPSPGAQGSSDAFVFGLSSGAAGVDSDGDGLSDEWETQYGLDPLTPDATGDPDGDGFTNAQELANNTHPTGYHTRYLAEGATGSFFDDRIALFNPGGAMATVLLRYQREGNPELQQLLALPAYSRLTVNPETIPGLEASSFSTVIESNQAVVVDRTMTWDATGFGSHAETSIEQVSTQWYLAEGATGGTFDLYYLLQNPSTQPAQVTISYLRPSGAPLVKTYTVNPRSRRTVNVDNESGFTGLPATQRPLANTDVSASIVSDVPILVERAMYMTAQGRLFAAGHNSAGITTPAVSWFLAEGATGSYFDLFILLANPNATPTTVEITYLLLGGQTITRQYGLAGQSRRTVYVDAEPGLADVATSAIVRSLDASVPIVVERAMWWPGGNWTEAHNSAGAIVTSPRWALAEGETGGTRANQTYVLLANTSPFAGQVRVTLYFEDQGEPLVTVYTVPAQSRYNVDLANTVAQGRRFSVLVEGLGATPPQLVVERAMYSNSGSTIWAAGTNALGTPLFPPNTLTVTPNGIFPKVLVVDEGTQVAIVNQDGNPHEISSDPHPTHEDCGAEFGEGMLLTGQSRVSNNLIGFSSCGIHDHLDPSNPNWNSRVIVRPVP